MEWSIHTINKSCNSSCSCWKLCNIKPSEVTPKSGMLVEEMFKKADAPDNLVQVLIGDGQVGADLINLKPDKVSFYR